MPPANPTPETPAQRQARQLAMLRRIAERAMALAERADDDAEAAPRDADPKPDHHLNFTRHARTVRIVIALERNLDADPARATRYRPTSNVHNDPRHAPLRRVLQKEARKHPNPAQLCRAVDDRIGQELADDPDQQIAIAEILVTLCNELGLDPDLAHLPDEVLVDEPAGPRRHHDWPAASGPPANARPRP